MKFEPHLIQGFLRDAVYSAYVSAVFTEFESETKDLDVTLDFYLKEIPYGFIGRTKSIEISIKDSKTASLSINISKYYDNKGRVTNNPSRNEVLDTIRSGIKRFIAQYLEKYPRTPDSH